MFLDCKSCLSSPYSFKDEMSTYTSASIGMLLNPSLPVSSVRLACVSPSGSFAKFDLLSSVKANGWTVSESSSELANGLANKSLAAAEHIYPYVRMTPLLPAACFQSETAEAIYLKMESEQVRVDYEYPAYSVNFVTNSFSSDSRCTLTNVVPPT